MQIFWRASPPFILLPFLTAFGGLVVSPVSWSDPLSVWHTLDLLKLDALAS
jgi:hypothetical protein